MHLSISYQTSFDYPQAARQSHNELRAIPATTPTQQLLSHRLTINPHARAITYRDYFGTMVYAFGVRAHHDSLDLLVEASVETTSPDFEPAPVDRAGLADDSFRSQHFEYLQPTAHTAWSERMDGVIRIDPELEVCELVRQLAQATHDHLDYVPGATHIGVTIDEVLECRQGVCQDYAHLMVALCRSCGVPARYVSGFLYAADDRTGEVGEADEVQVQTHAWVEVALPGQGWWPHDPTNMVSVGEHHVKIGHGRDYDDVPPLKGSYIGGGARLVLAKVEMRQILPPESALAAQQ